MATDETNTTGTPAVGRRPANGANGQPRPSREQVIADLHRMAAGEQQTETKPAATEAAPKEEPATGAAHRQHELEAHADSEPEEKDESEEEQPASDDAKNDPDLAKRLAIVAKHEKRAKDREQQAKAALEHERSTLRREREAFEREIMSARSEIEAFSKLKTRARYDPAGALRSLGLDDDDMGPAARQLWALSKEQAADPKNREAAAQLMKTRESEDRIAKLERELAERKKAEEERETQSRVAASVEKFLDGVVKAATDEHPLAKRLIGKSAEKARARFAQIAYALGERDGDMPDAEDVLAEYERLQKEELEAIGADYSSIVKPKAKPQNDNRPAATLGNDIGTTTAPKSTAKKTQAEKRAELEAELRAMDLKDR